MNLLLARSLLTRKDAADAAAAELALVDLSDSGATLRSSVHLAAGPK